MTQHASDLSMLEWGAVLGKAPWDPSQNTVTTCYSWETDCSTHRQTTWVPHTTRRSFNQSGLIIQTLSTTVICVRHFKVFSLWYDALITFLPNIFCDLQHHFFTVQMLLFYVWLSGWCLFCWSEDVWHRTDSTAARLEQQCSLLRRKLTVAGREIRFSLFPRMTKTSSLLFGSTQP